MNLKVQEQILGPFAIIIIIIVFKFWADVVGLDLSNQKYLHEETARVVFSLSSYCLSENLKRRPCSCFTVCPHQSLFKARPRIRKAHYLGS